MTLNPGTHVLSAADRPCRRWWVRRTWSVLWRLANVANHGEKTVKLMGCGLLLCALTSSAFAAGRYVEVWDPPEARGAVHRVTPARNQLTHRHAIAHPVNARARQSSKPAVKLTLKQHAVTDPSWVKAPDMTAIPRQITPEGNVLRVGSRQASVKVSR